MATGVSALNPAANYRLFDANNRLVQDDYLLSPKDLNTLDDLETIIASGCRLLKIEGRMKTPEYVYGITGLIGKASMLQSGIRQSKRLIISGRRKVFSRDFTKGHLFNEADLLNAYQVGKNQNVFNWQVVSPTC